MRNKYKKYWLLPALLVLICLISCANKIKNTAAVPGDINNFDPVAALSEVAAFAGKNPVLTRMEVQYIRPDGTIDVEAEYKPTIQYYFLTRVEDKSAEKELPVGVASGHKTPAMVWQATSVWIKKPFKRRETRPGVEGTYLMKHGGMEKIPRMWPENDVFKSRHDKALTDIGSPLPLKVIWQKAVDLGAPADKAVAAIIYDIDTGYSFQIYHTKHKYKFDLKGNKI